MSSERLGAIDAAYLEVEDERTPMHVASIGIFEAGPLLDRHGRFRLGEARARYAGRLDLLPRLRQRVAFVPFGLARPVWADDEHFDIAHHVDVVELPAPYDEGALLRIAEDLMMTLLDRERPLWHLRFVTGLEGNRVALIERAHHAMVDGVSGVDVSVVLLDLSPDAPAAEASGWVPTPTPTASELLIDGLVDRVRAPSAAAARGLGTLAHPARLVRGVRGVADALGTLAASGVRAPRTSLNRQVGASRKIVVVRERFDDVHAAGAAAGGTVNDVVLASVAGGMRALFVSRGEALATERTFKVLVPVSLRDASQSMTLGNRVGSLVVPLPIGIGDPEARLHAVIAATKLLKASNEATTTDAMLRAADLLPPRVAATVVRGVNHQPLVNSVVTNVPGPPCPLYAMGARMLEAIPIVPLAGNMDLEIAVLSYDGALTLGITSDRTTCPDVDVFAAGVEHSFAGLGVTWSPTTAKSHA